MTGASASRSPDRNGWYNHTLTVTFTGTDATSGIDTCTQASYSGPDSANASVSGVCHDLAGNTSTSSNFGFQYDETGPAVTATPVAQPGRERLVQPSPDGRLQRHGRDLRGRHL